MNRPEQQCSFCGLDRAGGVSGQGTPRWAYICPDCIRLTHQMIEGPPLVDQKADNGPEA